MLEIWTKIRIDSGTHCRWVRCSAGTLVFLALLVEIISMNRNLSRKVSRSRIKLFRIILLRTKTKVAYIYHGKCKTSNFRLNLHRKHYIETFYVSVPLSIHNIENLTSKMNKLWRLQVLKLPSLFITISFDVITFGLPQIRCNVQPPNNTSKKIRRIVFSVISVYEESVHP